MLTYQSIDETHDFDEFNPHMIVCEKNIISLLPVRFDVNIYKLWDRVSKMNSKNELNDVVSSLSRLVKVKLTSPPEIVGADRDEEGLESARNSRVWMNQNIWVFLITHFIVLKMFRIRYVNTQKKSFYLFCQHTFRHFSVKSAVKSVRKF